MFAKISIHNLDEAEKTAKEILEHIEAINALMKSASWRGISLEVALENQKAVSGN